jgi:hypothetical protein
MSISPFDFIQKGSISAFGGNAFGKPSYGVASLLELLLP